MLLDLMNLKGEKTCVVDNQLGSTSTIEVKNVGEFIEALIKDESKIASGLARHFPRAFSNLPNSSNEIIARISKSYEENDGKLLPMMEEYFKSETFSCARGDE